MSCVRALCLQLVKGGQAAVQVGNELVVEANHPSEARCCCWVSAHVLAQQVEYGRGLGRLRPGAILAHHEPQIRSLPVCQPDLRALDREASGQQCVKDLAHRFQVLFEGALSGNDHVV